MPLRKVTIIQPIAGSGFTYQSGEQVDLPELLAKTWVYRGLAEYLDNAEGVKPSATPAKRARKSISRKPEKIEKR